VRWIILLIFEPKEIQDFIQKGWKINPKPFKIWLGMLQAASGVPVVAKNAKNEVGGFSFFAMLTTSGRLRLSFWRVLDLKGVPKSVIFVPNAHKTRKSDYQERF
jgi:hypothetical protein